MAKLSDTQIKNIYFQASKQHNNAVNMQQLLELCLDPDSGITPEGLKAVNYPKIDLLEQQYYAKAEEVEWLAAQNDVDKLKAFIDKIEAGKFTRKYYTQAKQQLRELMSEKENEEWESVKASKDINSTLSFIKNCEKGIYSDTHLEEAKTDAEYLEWEMVRNSQDTVQIRQLIEKCERGVYPKKHDVDAMRLLETVEWQNVKDSGDPLKINSFIGMCSAGKYSQKYLEEAKNELDRIENGSILDDWNELNGLTDFHEKLAGANAFIQKYSQNLTETGQKYVTKATELIHELEEEEEARKDWITAKDTNTILGYKAFITNHPRCKYREEADVLIANMKGKLLNEMRQYPFRFNRENMYQYISTNVLTMEDLVDNSNILTDRGYSHIKQYPTLHSEQRDLPISKLENPTSEEGNTDIYFFGVSGSGKTCVLAGLMSLTGQLGFRFDPKGPGGGGNYAMELRNYARKSMLPPATDQEYIQVIDAQINDENNLLRKISLIEMSGEKTAKFSAMDSQENFDDLGEGAAGLMNNDNDKVIFFVIDPTNEKNIEIGGEEKWIMQCDVLDCVSALLARYKNFMKKVKAIHVILTKSDTLGDYADKAVVEQTLHQQGYQSVLDSIKAICERYDINKQTGFKVGVYPFCVGKFMPGDVYTFDETDSLKILRVIQKNVQPIINRKTIFGTLIDWFNN